MPSSVPAAVTAGTTAANPTPLGVADPPTVPTELLDQEEPIADVELELDAPEAPAPPAPPPAPPPAEAGRRRGRPPRSAAAAVVAPAPASVQPADVAPTDEELRALGGLMLLSRRLGEPLEQVVAHVRAMITAYDKFGG